MACSALLLPRALAAGAGGANLVYVSASGNDRNDGRAANRPVQSLERARDIARGLKSPRKVLLSGQFRRHAPLQLGGLDSDTVWQGLPQASIIGQDAVPEAMSLRLVRNLTIRDFAISGFTANGIAVAHSRGLTISGMRISGIRSTKWSQGAILLTGNTIDARIVGNLISDTDYSGIEIVTYEKVRVDNALVQGNRVFQSCKRVFDCGAIYINDRSKTAVNSRILDNIVVDFGPKGAGGRGIYLDDWASSVIVRGNCIAGPGVYAIHIHGGSNNEVSGNVIDARGLDAVIHNQPNDRDRTRPMTGNRFAGNKVIVGAGAMLPLVRERAILAGQRLSSGANMIEAAGRKPVCPA